MKTNRLINAALLATLGLASVLPAQQRDRRSERDERNGDAELKQRSTGASPTGLPQSSPQSTTRPATYSGHYAILERNNIFVRDRSRPASRPIASSTTRPVRRSPEQSLVVRGIAMEELGYRAYVEDLNTGSTLRVSPGDPLGPGHVRAVALDAIAYEQNGKQTWIDIGSDLTGKQSALAAASSLFTPASTTAPATLPANVDLNDPSLTVEQRMRLRVQLRQQNRGQGN